MESGELRDLEAVLAPDFVMHGPHIEGTLGRQDVARAIEELAASFDERRYLIEELLAEEDRVVARYTVSGRQRADYQGIASRGRRFSIAAVSIYRVADGCITEEWELVDRKGLLEQLTGHLWGDDALQAR